MLQLLTGPQDPSQIQASLNALITQLNQSAGVTGYAFIGAPLAADLVYIKAAATPANGAIVIAHQPDTPRKLQVRIVLGTPGTTNITAGTLTLTGFNAQGQAIAEVVQLNQFGAVSGTYVTANAFAGNVAGVVAAYAANGSGTGNTLGIGQSAALGLPLPAGFSGLSVFKEVVDNADEAVGAVDPAAGTVIPTTAPNAAHNYAFWFSSNTSG